MMGLEYGRRSVSASVREEGLVVPMACLNRVWCCGFYVSEGQKGRVSLSASEENFGRQVRLQKSSVGAMAGEEKVPSRRFEVTGIGARFGVQDAEPLRAEGGGSVSMRVSEEVHAFGKHDLGP